MHSYNHEGDVMFMMTNSGNLQIHKDSHGPFSTFDWRHPDVL